MSNTTPAARKEAVNWMARKLRLSPDRDLNRTFSWYVSGDALDAPGGPHGSAREYLEWLYADENGGTIGQIRRFKADCLRAANERGY